MRVCVPGVAATHQVAWHATSYEVQSRRGEFENLAHESRDERRPRTHRLVRQDALHQQKQACCNTTINYNRYVTEPKNVILSSDHTDIQATLRLLTIGVRNVTNHRHGIKGKGSPYSTAKHRVPELIPVLGSQPAGDVSHKPGGRLPLLSAWPAVTLTNLKRVASNFAAW